MVAVSRIAPAARGGRVVARLGTLAALAAFVCLGATHAGAQALPSTGQNAVATAHTEARGTASAFVARDADLVAAVAAHLGAKAVVRAEFRQTQTLVAMKHPLVSTGSLVFLRERGVIWRVDAPYRALYVIGDAGVTEYDETGKRRARASRSTAGVAQVAMMMRAMLGGDLSALYSQFDVSANGTAARWRMQLKPNQPQLAQAIAGLTLEGGAFLQSIAILAANGDVTRIDFSGSTAPEAASADELALLGERQ